MSAKLAKSSRYPNLFRDESSGTWIFRKYSSVKRREFYRSTGERDNEARAYKNGVEAFNDWIGKVSDDAGVIYFGRFARKCLKEKLENPRLSKGTKAEFKRQLEAAPSAGPQLELPRPRLIDAFGHLPIEKVTAEAWKAWKAEIRMLRPKFKFFNCRKALLDVMRQAYEAGHIDRLPKFELADAPPAPPRELKPDELRKLFRAVHYVDLVRGPGDTSVVRRRPNGTPYRTKNWIKLLMLFIWKQGARPGEILQYEWAMFDLEEGPTGTLRVPARLSKNRRGRTIPLNAEVQRVLRFLRPRATSRFLFPSPDDPGRPMAEYHKTWAGVVKRSGFRAQMYWFRDTFVTRKIREREPLIMIAAYIDSSPIMLARKYAVPSEEDLSRVAR